MASLGASQRLGNTNTSSLIRSSRSLSAQITAYQDDVQALTYANSAYTDDSFKTYQDYLTGRINRLNSTGNIADATKAITLTKTLEGATHSNVSASITRENIQIMSGNGTLQDKYNLIASQFQRAMGIGDLTLAQTLEKQAYDVNQTIQYQAQQSADAAATLAKAGNGRTTGTSGVSYQGEVVSNLQEGLKYINSLAKDTSEKELNKSLGDYVKQATPALNALGVHISAGQQPNYFDVVYGITGAIYNAQVLKAQAEASSNPLVAKTYATEAAQMLNGGTKFQTLAGNLTVKEIQQAQQDPNMFTYDNSKGSYVRDIQNGFQYMNFTDANGNTTTQLAPKYSNFADTGSGRKDFNQVEFLTPQETTTMTKLGLNFTENKSGTTGEGVQFAITQNTPQWLKSILGDKGIGNMFTGENGFVNFKAGSASGQGDSYFTLATDEKGLSGLFEHLGNGSTNLVGGDYGFSGQAVQMLVNQGQQVQYRVRVAQAQAQAALKVQQAAAAQQAEALRVAATPPPVSQVPQRTVSPQPPTLNPQQASPNSTNILQPSAGALPSNVQGVPLTQPHLNGIRL